MLLIMMMIMMMVKGNNSRFEEEANSGFCCFGRPDVKRLKVTAIKEFIIIIIQYHHHNHLVKVTIIKKFLSSPLHISSGVTVNPSPPMTSTYPQQQASAPPLHGHQYPAAGYPPQVYLTKVSYSTLCHCRSAKTPLQLQTILLLHH